MKKINNYKMSEGNYDDYKEIYGLKYSNSPQGDDVKNGNAKFYIIKDGDEYITFIISNQMDTDLIDFIKNNYSNLTYEKVIESGYEYTKFRKSFNSNEE